MGEVVVGDEKKVYLFCDGACSGNPGPGGWGAVLRSGNHEKELSGFDPATTNNRMELEACIQGLMALKGPSQVVVTTDSQYLRKGITEWVHNWKKRGWKNSRNQPVKNIDVWKRLLQEVKHHEIEWHWVKGHSGHPENERADVLATNAVAKGRRK